MQLGLMLLTPRCLPAHRHPELDPALVTFSLIRFQASWDAFFWPLIVAASPEKRVVQIAIATSPPKS